MNTIRKATENEKIIILGEPASKSNSRRLVTIRGRPAFIKSKKAIEYVKSFDKQCPTLENLLEGDLEATITIHYATRRPDLDESLILDLMQGLIYRNDRQVKSKAIYHGLDKQNPRTIIRVSALESGNIPEYLRCLPTSQTTEAVG